MASGRIPAPTQEACLCYFKLSVTLFILYAHMQLLLGQGAKDMTVPNLLFLMTVPNLLFLLDDPFWHDNEASLCGIWQNPEFLLSNAVC